MMSRRFALVAVAALVVSVGPQRAQGSVAAWTQDAQKQADEARKQADQIKKQAAEARAQAKAWKDKHASEAGEEFTDHFVRTFKAGPQPAVVLSNIAGDITVSASAGNEIKLEAVKRVMAKSEADARRQLDSTRIEVDDHSGRIDIRTAYMEGKNKVSVDYVVTAPAATILDIRSVTGDVTVDGIKGEVRAETVSGDLLATGLAEESSLKAVSGDVSATSIVIDGDLTVSSVSGDVLIKNFKARSVNVGTVSGNVRLHYGASERLLARSVNGDVEMAGSLLKGGVYEFKSHSGNIKLFVDAKSGFTIDASSFSGQIKTDLPVSIQSSSQGDRYADSGRNIHAVFGDGSARVDVSTFSGNVGISGKK